MSAFQPLLAVWPYVAGVLLVGAVLAASVHVVLTRRNPSAALAWIGLIWLAPFIGLFLYFLLGINRIHRKASALRSVARSAETPEPTIISAQELEPLLRPVDRHIITIARLGDRTAGRPLLPGNRVQPLRNGDEAFPAMIDAIDSARRSVSLATYIFDNDRAGHAFADALRNALNRGVQVRVLVDNVGARYSFQPMTGVLQRAGIPVARFMRAIHHWRMPYFNLRNHRKLLVVDGEVGFTGGINIREGHWLALRPSSPVQDLHFRVDGPGVAELQLVFADDWLFTTGESLEGEIWFPPLEQRGDTVLRGLADGPDDDFEKLQTIILGALTAARRSVRIVTPYFVPDQALVTALNVTALRGVDVQIILPEKNNLVLVHWASRAHWWQILEKGCRLFLSAPPFDHSKLMVVDDVWCLFGSANWDPRSLQLNFEFNLESYDSRLARSLLDAVEQRRANAREVTLEHVLSQSFPVRLRDGVARLFSPYL